MSHIPNIATAEDGGGNFDPQRVAAPPDHTTGVLPEPLGGLSTPGMANHEHRRT